MAAIAVAAGSCADFAGLRVGGQDGGEPDASEAGCPLTHPPRLPLLGTVGGSVDFDAVVWHVDLGDALPDAGSPAYQSIGFDLDDACTTPDAGRSCKEPAWAATINHADGPGGIDNSVGADLFQIHKVAAGSASALVNSSNDTGGLQLAIRVRGYNGLGVDAQVDVSYYGVVIHFDGDAAPRAPRWDGTDAWDVYPPWLAPPEAGVTANIEAPAFEDKHAFVTNVGIGGDGLATGLLVSRVAELLVGSTPPFRLSQVMMTAEIVKSGGSWTLRNGTLAGRMRIDAFLGALAFAPDSATGSLFCRNAGSYALAKALTCAYADISYSGPDDGSQPCDGASWGWRFLDAVPASLAGVAATFPAPDAGPCPPGQSPTDDHCGP